MSGRGNHKALRHQLKLLIIQMKPQDTAAEAITFGIELETTPPTPPQGSADTSTASSPTRSREPRTPSSSMKKPRKATPFTSSRFTVSVIREDATALTGMDTPESARRFWDEVIAIQPDHEPDKENLVVVLLDVRLRPFAWNRVALGSLTDATAHPREILRPVIVGAANGFVMFHNHPSGDPTPSAADRSVTRRIQDASSLLQIHFYDHLIIGNPTPGTPGYFSFREHGMI